MARHFHPAPFAREHSFSTKTKALRSMPRTFFRYVFFCFITPSGVLTCSSESESSWNGNFIAGGGIEIVASAEIGSPLLRPRSAVKSEGVAAGAGKTEVADRLAEHFQRF